MEKEIKKPIREHYFHYEKGKLSVFGVENLLNFDEKQVEMALDGNVLNAQGEDLNVAKVDLDAGCIEVTGKLNCLKYLQKTTPQGFFKRLLK